MPIDFTSPDKSPNIWIPNQDVINKSTESGEMYHLGDYFPYEENTLKAYWGHYFEPKQKVGAISTTTSILCTYIKLRDNKLMNAMMNPEHPNFFYKRDVLWKWLVEHEADMHLPFKSQDGREGKPFAMAMPVYANLTLENKEKKL
jgi:hypothetical protein